MAHELDTRDNGQASFVSLRKDAWHQLGTVQADELSYEEAMRLGGLDYPLELRPVKTTVPIFDANGVEHDSLEVSAPAQAIVRTDRQVVFGVVGPSYQLVNNREATEVVKVMVEEGLARIETAGALRDGRDAWMALRFIGANMDEVSDNEGDPVNFYGMVRANHDGKCSVQIATTPVRVVCANTLAMALSDGSTSVRAIRHTRNAGSKLVAEAKALWGGVYADALDMTAAFARMRRTEITSSQLDIIAKIVAPDPAPLAPDASDRSRALYASAIEKARSARMTITAMIYKGTGVDGTLSAWNVFNAVTESIDHAGVGRASRGAAKSEPLVAQLPGGAIASLKHNVWNTLLTIAA